LRPPVGLLPPGVVLLSSDFPILALILLANVIKALSTFVLAFADASMNLIPKLSANSFPSSYVTYLLLSKSALLPTNNLTTFSDACFSTSKK
jgi:hypothetical protein